MAAPFVCVGAAGGPANCCVLPNSSVCSYNPDLIAVASSNRDCNDNRTDDAIDVALGTSPDDDGDGIPDECGPQPTLHMDVTVGLAAGPPYPTDTILIDVRGAQAPPKPIVPVEVFALSLQDALPPSSATPIPMQLEASDDGGSFYGGAATVNLQWMPSPIDSFESGSSFQLLVELLPFAGHSSVGGNPPDDIVPSPTSFDVTFEVAVQPNGGFGSTAGFTTLGTALHTLHFEIGAGQPLEFANVVVGSYDGSFDHPAFPISFELITDGSGGDPDPNTPLVKMTMEGEFTGLALADIPAVSLWGFVFLCAILLVAGTLVIRTRRAACDPRVLG